MKLANIVIQGYQNCHVILYGESLEKPSKIAKIGNMNGDIIQYNKINHLYYVYYNLTNIKISPKEYYNNNWSNICHINRSIDKNNHYLINKVISIKEYQITDLPKNIYVDNGEKLLRYINPKVSNNKHLSIKSQNYLKTIDYLSHNIEYQITIPIDHKINCTYTLEYNNKKMMIWSFVHNFKIGITKLTALYKSDQYRLV